MHFCCGNGYVVGDRVGRDRGLVSCSDCAAIRCLDLLVLVVIGLVLISFVSIGVRIGVGKSKVRSGRRDEIGAGWIRELDEMV